MFHALRARQYGSRATVPRLPFERQLVSDVCDVHSFSAAEGGSSSLPFALSFAPSAAQRHWLAVADEDGRLSLINTRRELTTAAASLSPSPRLSFSAHANAVFSVAFSLCSSRVLTASADQTVNMFDLSVSLPSHSSLSSSPCSPSPCFSYRGHSGSVKSVSSCPHHGDLFASGGRDGFARVWDVRQKGDVSSGVAFSSAETTSRKRGGGGRRITPSPAAAQSVTGVQFLSEHVIAASASTSGTVRLFDLRYSPRPAPLAAFAPPPPPAAAAAADSCCRQYGATDLQLSPCSRHLLVSCTNHAVYQYAARGGSGCAPEGRLEAVYRAGHSSSFYSHTRWSADGSSIACGSLDGGVWIYRKAAGQRAGRERGQAVVRRRAVRVLRGHEEEVGCVAWGGDGDQCVASGGDDHTVRLWRPRDATRKEDDDDESESTTRSSREEEEEEDDAEAEEGEDQTEDESADAASDKENDADGVVSTSPPSLPPPPLSDVSNVRATAARGDRTTTRRRGMMAFLRPAGDESCTSPPPPLSSASSPSSRSRAPAAKRARTLLELWQLPVDKKASSSCRDVSMES